MLDIENNWYKIVNELIENELTISTMESCTGGGIANAITNISGASAVIKESYVTYCNEAKIKHGVPEILIEQFTVYSPEVAVAMAKAVKEQTGSDIGIGVTGQLGRIDPDNTVDKLNTVWYSIIDEENNVVVKEIQVPDSERKEQKEFIIYQISKSLINIKHEAEEEYK